MIDRNELRRLAQAIPDKKEPGESSTSFIRRRSTATLEFRDAANPITVLELLDEIERLRGEMISRDTTQILEAWKKLAREYATEIQRGDAKCRELQTEIERLRALLRKALDALQITQADVQLTSNAYEAQHQTIAAIRAELGDK